MLKPRCFWRTNPRLQADAIAEDRFLVILVACQDLGDDRHRSVYDATMMTQERGGVDLLGKETANFPFCACLACHSKIVLVVSDQKMIAKKETMLEKPKTGHA